MRTFTTALMASACILMPLAASASSISIYISTISELNDSGVSGKARLTLDRDAKTLAFDMKLTGLEPNQLHVQHIHGTFGNDGMPSQAMSPTIANDADGDGFIELGEGIPSYGLILVSLTIPGQTDNGGFPVTTDGTLSFSQIYDLSDMIYAANVLTPEMDDTFGLDDLLPLNLREIVIHGMSLAFGEGSGMGEADGTAGYKTVLPVASGVIVPAAVPVPAAGLLLAAGLGGMSLLRRRKAA